MGYTNITKTSNGGRLLECEPLSNTIQTVTYKMSCIQRNPREKFVLKIYICRNKPVETHLSVIIPRLCNVDLSLLASGHRNMVPPPGGGRGGLKTEEKPQ